MSAEPRARSKEPQPIDEFCEKKGCRAMPGQYCKLHQHRDRTVVGAFHGNRWRKAKQRLKKSIYKGKCGKCKTQSICEFAAYRPCE